MKKLPELYTNTFNKKIDNSQDYITISNNDILNEKQLTKYEIKKKIDNIFKSKDYIYKTKTEITLKDKIITETIIGKVNNNLITMDNKLIDINDIINIKKVN